jgi:hypothetical protein
MRPFARHGVPTDHSGAGAGDDSSVTADVRPRRPSSVPGWLHLLTVATIVIVSFSLNRANNSFPVDYHRDEPKKISLVMAASRHDFRHPLLMIQIARIANGVLAHTRTEDLVRMARTLTAAIGALIPLLAFLLALGTLGSSWALVVAVAVAVSPILVIHAHYFKEDVLFTACSLGSILCFRQARTEQLGRRRVWVPLWGAATGLAIAAQYKGLLLLALYAMVPRIAPGGRLTPSGKEWRWAVAAALVTFAIVNYPLFVEPGAFTRGLFTESRHALRGHSVRIWPFEDLFTFHFRHSLMPGMTPVVALLALAGTAALLARWRRRAIDLQVMIAWVLLFYLAHEASPTKPFPDFMRYVLPIVPLLLIFAYGGLSLLGERLAGTALRWLVPGVVALSVALPAWESARLIRYLEDDTRRDVAAWLAARGEKAKLERYAGIVRDTDLLTVLNPDAERAAGTRYLVASSFTYDRFRLARGYRFQKRHAYETYRKYEGLFQYPYQEFRPKYKGFAFSNPTIRVIDISAPTLAERAPPTAPGPPVR